MLTKAADAGEGEVVLIEPTRYDKSCPCIENETHDVKLLPMTTVVDADKSCL